MSGQFIQVAVSGNQPASEGLLSHKHWRPGSKRPVSERKMCWKIGGDGQWVKLERYIDREKNLYYERVEDQDGNVLVEKDEPLHHHR